MLFLVPRICVVAKPGKIKWHKTNFAVQAWLIFLIVDIPGKNVITRFSCVVVITLKGKKKFFRIWHIKEMVCYNGTFQQLKKPYGKILKCLHFFLWWNDEICMQKNLKLGETFCSCSLQQSVSKIWISMKNFGIECFWSSTWLIQQGGNTPEFWSRGNSLLLLTCWARQDVMLWGGF